MSLISKPRGGKTRLLEKAGLRSTRQRQALADYLFDGMHKHMTAEDVHAAMRKNRAPMALATVYNALHRFTDAGLLRQIVLDPSRVYFDTNTGDHHHFFDEDSGHLTDIPARAVHIAKLPRPPAGRRVGRVDVVIRVHAAAASAGVRE